MKKTLLLFAMLLGVVGAWAQPKVSDAPQDGQWNVNTTWFVITLKGSNSILTTTFTDNENALMIDGQTTTAPGDDALWCVVGDATNGYKFYNKAIGTSKILGITGSEDKARTRMVADATDGYTTTFDFTQSGVTGGTFWSIKTHGSTNNYLNNRGRYLALWANNSAYGSNGTGSAFLFEEADIEELDIEFTDNTGTIHSGKGKCIKNAGGTLNSRFTIAGIPSEWLKDVKTEDDKYKATLNLPFRLSNETQKYKHMMGGHGVNNFKIYANETNVQVQKSKSPTSATDVNPFLWEIYPNLQDGVVQFSIKNVETGSYIYSETPQTSHDAGTLTLSTEKKTSFILKKVGNDATFAVQGVNISINSSSSSNVQPVGLNYYTHNGTNMTFIPYWITYTLTDMAGGKHTGEYEGWSDWQPELPTFTGAEGYSVGEKTWGNGTVSAPINFGLTVSSETEVNQLVISIGENANRKWIAKKNSNNGEMYVHITSNDGTPELGTGQWAIYPILNGTQFGFKIKNIATDTYVYAKPDNTGAQPQPQGFVDNNKNSNPVILNNEGTIFEMVTPGSSRRFKYTSEYNNGTTLYLTVNGSASYDCPLGVWNKTHNSTDYENVTFPNFNEYKITIGETGYTTLYSPFPVIFNDQYNTNTAEYYAITSETTGNTVRLTDMSEYSNWYGSGDYIPANQGAILKGESGTYTFTKIDPIEEFDNAWSNNKLKGSVTNTYVEGDAYVLSAPDGVESVGLYKALLNKNANGESGNTHFKNNAGKAYLPASALSAEAAESRFFVFSFGDDMETGITETENGNVNAENTVVYDLAGRRVQGAQKGIFIVNGKKVVR